MADTIGTVRVELVADPSGIERGIEQASGALTRIATIGTFVGNLLAQAFDFVAGKFVEMVTEITSGQGDVWDELSRNARNAATLLHNSFKQLGEGATEFQAAVAERVLPGIAALAERFTDLAENSVVAKVGIEVLVGGFKVLATAAAIVLQTLQLLGQALATVGGAAQVFGSAIAEAGAAAMSFNWAGVTAALSRIPQELGRVLQQSGTDMAETLRGTGRLINDIWNETAISTARAGERIKVEVEGLDRHMRRLAEQAKKVFEDTRTPYERLQFQLDRLNVLLQKGLISWDTYQRAVQMAQDKISGAQEAMRAIGQSFEQAFVDAVTGAKSLSDALRSLLKDLGRIAAQAVFRQLFGSVFGFTGGGAKTGFGSAFPGFASGGSFEVGGAGGIDSQVVAFRATPGERVVIGHESGAGSRGGMGQPRVTINNYAQAEVSASRTSEEDLEITVRGLVRDEFNSSRMNPIMAGKHGIRPRVRAR